MIALTYDVGGSPSEPRARVASQEPAPFSDYRFTEFLASCRATPRAFASCASLSTMAAKSARVPKPWAWTVMVSSVCATRTFAASALSMRAILG